MTFKGHIIFYLAFIILAKKLSITASLSQGDWWSVIASGLLTCLLPDIDHPRSILGCRFPRLSKTILKIFGHRGFTHSLLLIIIFFSFFTIINYIFSTYNTPNHIWHAMIIGYSSHIIADMLTPYGVLLLWPFKKRFHILIIAIKKNIQQEYILCIIILIFSIQYSNSTFYIFYSIILNSFFLFWYYIQNIFIFTISVFNIILKF